MSSVSYPGVYVDEVSSGVRPITAASTSTAAFIGRAEKGSLTEAVRLLNFTEFQSLYGNYLTDSYLGHAAFQFFNNGGSILYIARVAGLNVETANIVLNDRAVAPQASVTIDAVSPGVWGNGIEIEITDGTNDPGNQFNIEVFTGGGLTAIESFRNLSMVPGTANFVDTAVNSSLFVRATASPANTNAVAGTSQGSAAPTVPLPAARTRLQINVNGDGYQEVNLQDAVDDGTVADLTTAANVVAALASVVDDLVANRISTDQNAFDNFVVTLLGGNLLLSSGVTGTGSSVNVAPAADASQDATGLLNIGVLQGGIETLGGAITRPVANSGAVPRYFLGDHTGVPTAEVLSVLAGSDGDPINNDQPYIDAFSRLDNKNDISLVAVPGIGSSTVVGAGMNYCENRSLSDCFFIGDMALDDDDVNDAQSFVTGISPKNSYGAVYTPWLLSLDPTGVSPEPISVPPSGYMAGLYAKTDAKRGVWKAPAGTGAGIGGSTGLVANFTDVEQGLLNPAPYNVNVIRQFAASGRVIWGARTISADAEWRYINVRRMAIMLRVSIYNGIQWAIFEPNDEPLWAQLRVNITAFMMTLFRQGAFQGSKPADAFFVKCDSETTTQADIDNGVVNVSIGFAPRKPAEFVVVKISQKAGQSS